MDKPRIHFVGRENELREFEKLLETPCGEKRVAFVLGGGGVGKTQLVNEMIVMAGKHDFLAPSEPLDLFDTDLRSIDGIQRRLVQVIEAIAGLEGESSPFAEFKKKYQDTSERFYTCLKAFCESRRLVLAFDTFENLNTNAANWLFESREGGLQVPGLICIIAGRPERPNSPSNDTYRENLEGYKNKLPLVKTLQITGLTKAEAKDFYQRLSNEYGEQDLLKETLNIAGIEFDQFTQDEERLDWIYQVTGNGHPLKLEMAYRWAHGLIPDDARLNLRDPIEFESALMGEVSRLGKLGQLGVGAQKISQSVFDGLLCMGYVTRRFDEKILRWLIEKKLLPLEAIPTTEDIVKILADLETYFFVKRRSDGKGGYFFQLHDEMARLVRTYGWSSDDPAKKDLLFEQVRLYYRREIESTTDEYEKNILLIEDLHYILLNNSIHGKYIDGAQRWVELANQEDDGLNSLLPGEIQDYVDGLDIDPRHEILERIAQIERDAKHMSQARNEFERVLELGKQVKNHYWVASAMLGVGSCLRDPSDALTQYEETLKYCTENYPQYVARLYYNIGFTYRRMQRIDDAIEWYRKAQKEYQRKPGDKDLSARIANDLGYAYALKGNHVDSIENVKKGLEIRTLEFHRLEHEVQEIETKLQNQAENDDVVKLKERLRRHQNLKTKALYQLGLSYNTLGEVHRYEGDLNSAERDYFTAFNHFETTGKDQWQAHALFSLGETRRRIAHSYLEDGDEAGYLDMLDRAEENIKESLYLCEKHQLTTERDTANRRMGRVLHDRGMYFYEKGEKEKAEEYLEKAKTHFEEGMRYAEATRDSLEELNNATELAFLVDDLMEVYHLSTISDEYRVFLKKFEDTLIKHQNDKYPIYHYRVFENLFALENAATAFQAGDYKKALDGYLTAMTKLALDPGYGRTRFKQHFSHLTKQIERLEDIDQNEAVKWCKEFINTWETTYVNDTDKRLLADVMHRPDLVEWCRGKLIEIEGGDKA